MRKQLTVALGLAVLATPAFATKARLQALGEDIYGSQYINDNRNIWLNAAQINNHKDLVTYEFGSQSTTVDTASAPRSEGGVYKSMGNLVYGAHFGSGSNTSNQLRAGGGLLDAATVSGTSNEENNIDVFVGGDAGLKWGANLGYAKHSDQGTDTRGESLRTRLGVIMGDTQVYANLNLINNAKGAGAIPGSAANFEGKLGFQVGAVHGWDGNSVFVDYRQFDAESHFSGQGKEDQMVKQAYGGIGRVTRVNDKTNLFTKAMFLWADTENDTAVAGNFSGAGCAATPYLCTEYKTKRVPVVVGLENDATSWLTLRASVAHNVWSVEEDDTNERTVANSLAVNAGATLKFGELSVDGVVGNNDGTSSGIGENTSAGSGTLRTDNLMTRVGMTYRF